VYGEWFSEGMCLKPHLLLGSNRMLQNVLYLGTCTLFTSIKPKQSVDLNLWNTGYFPPIKLCVDHTNCWWRIREILFFLTAHKMEITIYLLFCWWIEHKGEIKLNGLIKNVANVAL